LAQVLKAEAWGARRLASAPACFRTLSMSQVTLESRVTAAISSYGGSCSMSELLYVVSLARGSFAMQELTSFVGRRPDLWTLSGNLVALAGSEDQIVQPSSNSPQQPWYSNPNIWAEPRSGSHGKSATWKKEDWKILDENWSSSHAAGQWDSSQEEWKASDPANDESESPMQRWMRSRKEGTQVPQLPRELPREEESEAWWPDPDQLQSQEESSTAQEKRLLQKLKAAEPTALHAMPEDKLAAQLLTLLRERKLGLESSAHSDAWKVAAHTSGASVASSATPTTQFGSETDVADSESGTITPTYRLKQGAGDAWGLPHSQPQTSSSRLPCDRVKLRQDLEKADLVLCLCANGEEDLLERWRRHINGSQDPCSAAEKIQKMMVKLARQGFLGLDIANAMSSTDVGSPKLPETNLDQMIAAHAQEHAKEVQRVQAMARQGTSRWPHATRFSV